MLSTRILTVLSVGALMSLGCGDSGTGGSGAGSSGGEAAGGSPGTGGEAPGGAPPEGGGGGGVGGDAPIGGESAGGAPGTGGGGGGLAGFLEACTENADCESNICHEYNGQGVMLCTIECKEDGDCPAPSDGCNGMGICKPAA